MAVVTSEQFEGFPPGEVRYVGYNNELMGFLLRAAEVFLNEEGATPEHTWQSHSMQTHILTDLPDPASPETMMQLSLTVPLSAEDYLRIRHPKFELPEAPAVEALVEVVAKEEADETTEPSVLSMFLTPEEPDEDIDDDQPEAFSWTQRENYKRNKKLLLHAEYFAAIADNLSDVMRLEDCLASYGVVLEQGQRALNPANLGFELAFEGAGDRRYVILGPSRTSRGTEQHVSYTSPSTGIGYTTLDDGHQGDRIADVEAWRDAVRVDVETVKNVLRGAADYIAANVPADLFEEPSYEIRHKRGQPFSYGYGVSRAKEYVTGSQQFFRAGAYLMHATQDHEWASDLFGSAYEHRARIDVSLKKTDESSPHHIAFFMDTDMAATVEIVKLMYPEGFNGMLGRVGGYYTDQIGRDRDTKHLEQEMRRSGLTGEEIAESLDTRRRWGLEPNPFSHTDFYRAIEFLSQVAGLSE